MSDTDKTTDAEQANAAATDAGVNETTAPASENGDQTKTTEPEKVAPAAAKKAKALTPKQHSQLRDAADTIHAMVRGDLKTLDETMMAKHKATVKFDEKAGQHVVKIHGREARGRTPQIAYTNWGNAARRALLQAA